MDYHYHYHYADHTAAVTGAKMTEDASAFSLLPAAVRDSILTGAIKQLDQRHKYGITPLVCKLWRQFSLRASDSITITLTSAAAMAQLRSWLVDHGNLLCSLSISIRLLPADLEAAPDLIDAISCATQLRDLRLVADRWDPFEEVIPDWYTMAVFSRHALPALTELTSLTFRTAEVHNASPDFLASIPALTQLRALDLSVPSRRVQDFLPSLAEGLQQLTFLDLSGTAVPVAQVPLLRGLPELKELRLAGELLPADVVEQCAMLPITAAGVTVGSAQDVQAVCSWLQQPRTVSTLRDFYLASGTVEKHDVSPTLQCLSSITQLQHLHLFRVCLDTANLAALSALNSLHMTACDLDDAALWQLSGLSRLQHLSILGNKRVVGGDGVMEALAAGLHQLTTLELQVPVAAVAAQRAFGARVVKIYKKPTDDGAVGLSITLTAAVTNV